MLSSISPGLNAPPPAACALSAVNTTTPSSAPIGSISTPSHLSTERTFSDGRTNSSSGSTTVGPDTTRIAPSISDEPQPEPEDQLRGERDPDDREHDADRNQPQHDAAGASLQLIEAQPQPGLEQDQADPQRHDRLERVAEQEGRMDVIAWRRPAMNPAGSSNTIAGRCVRDATSWQPSASTITSPRPRRMLSVVVTSTSEGGPPRAAAPGPTVSTRQMREHPPIRVRSATPATAP